MAASPAFQFYATDWLASVSSMTLEERGAYITLLAWSWEHGAVPNDLKRVAAILGTHLGHARRLWAEVCKRWHLTDQGDWRNRRLEIVRADAIDFRERQAAKGRASALARSTAVSTAVRTAVSTTTPTGLATGGQPDTQPGGNPPISDLRSLDQEQDQKRSRLTATASALVDLWNTTVTPPLPQCRGLSGSRQRHANSRLAEAPLDEWAAVIVAINASRFCRGDNDRGWKASFDWLLQPDTRLRVLEGKYAGKQAQSVIPLLPRETPEQTRARWARENAGAPKGGVHE